MMKIEKVLRYDWNYAEYIVTDGINNVICMCISVPLPYNKIPQIGMEVSMLYAFAFDDIKIVKILKEEDKFFLIKKGKSYFNYKMRGRIIDKEKSIVKIYDLLISLEYQFENGFPSNYYNDDFIDFDVDRLDCYIK